MAALVLSVAGGAAGAVFGPAGAIAGRIAGALVGNIVDRSLFAEDRSVQGPRLADLDVMASTEGAPIPRVYGRARLSGQVIWATRLQEVVSTRTEGGSGGARADSPAEEAAAPPPQHTLIMRTSRSGCAKARSAMLAASGPTANRSTSPASICASIAAARTRRWTT
jgi:hypothetical protein